MTRAHINRDWLLDDCRVAVLAALDAWAEASGLPVRHGWKDGDLPALFRALDAQVDRVIARSGATVPDHSPYAAGSAIPPVQLTGEG